MVKLDCDFTFAGAPPVGRHLFWVNTSKAISASYYSHRLTLCGSDSFDGMNSPNGVHSLMCTGVAHYSTLTQLKKNEIIWTCLYILQSQHIGHPTLYHFPEGTPWREWEWSRSKGTSFGAPNTNQSTRSLSHNRFYWLSFWKKKKMSPPPTRSTSMQIKKG